MSFMKVAHRIGFYGFGVFLGLIVLFFFLGGKKASCDYSPNARVLKNIRVKKHEFSEASLAFMKQNTLDTSDISLLLKEGSVDFSKSNTKLDSCKTYFIEGISTKNKQITAKIANCDSIARFLSIEVFE